MSAGVCVSACRRSRMIVTPCSTAPSRTRSIWPIWYRCSAAARPAAVACAAVCAPAGAASAPIAPATMNDANGFTAIPLEQFAVCSLQFDDCDCQLRTANCLPDVHGLRCPYQIIHLLHLLGVLQHL